MKFSVMLLLDLCFCFLALAFGSVETSTKSSSRKSVHQQLKRMLNLLTWTWPAFAFCNCATIASGAHRYHVNGFGGCYWGLHFMSDKHRYGCAPVWRFCTDSSREIRPSNSRLLFLPNPLPSLLTLIHYKKVQNILQRSPVQWKVGTWLVIEVAF